jgi:hypothetical protein
MKQFTRGPLVADGVFVFKAYPGRHRRECIADLSTADVPPEIAEANANLFAKAPDNLSALMEIEKIAANRELSDQAKLNQIQNIAFNAISRVIGINR